MKNYRYYSTNGINYALNNLVSYKGTTSLVDLQDIITSSKTSKELLDSLKKVDLLGITDIRINKETDTFVRLELKDCWGNKTYLQADFDEKQIPKENSLQSYYLKSKDIVLNETELLQIYQFYKFEMLKEYISENYDYSKEEVEVIAGETERIMSKTSNYSEDAAIQEAITRLDLEPLSYEEIE